MDKVLTVPFLRLNGMSDNFPNEVVSGEALLDGVVSGVVVPSEVAPDGKSVHAVESLAALDEAFAVVPEHKIDTLNWPDSFPYAPDVRFRLFHNGKHLFLQYDVAEKYTAALEAVDGNEVYKDSCVEFFMRVDGEQSYYNFEWNAAGTMYMTYRPGRQSSEPAPKEILRCVIRSSSIGPAPVAEYPVAEGYSSVDSKCKTHENVESKGNGPAEFTDGAADNKWRLRVAIPVEALWHSGLQTFAGLRATANFFKCGDGLTVPHYLTWAPVHTPSPDYHRPEFFAPLEFTAE